MSKAHAMANLLAREQSVLGWLVQAWQRIQSCAVGLSKMLYSDSAKYLNMCLTSLQFSKRGKNLNALFRGGP